MFVRSNKSVVFNKSVGLFKFSVSLLTLCLVVWPIIESEILKAPTVNVLLPILPSIQYLLHIFACSLLPIEFLLNKSLIILWEFRYMSWVAFFLWLSRFFFFFLLLIFDILIIMCLSSCGPLWIHPSWNPLCYWI